MNKKNLSLFAGSIVFFGFAACRNLIPAGNILFFAAACAVFAIVAIGTYIPAVSGKLPVTDRLGKAAALAASFLTAAWMIAAYIFEPNEPQPLDSTELIRRTFPLPLWLPVMALGTALCLILLKRSGSSNSRLRKALRIIAAAAAAVFCALQTYAPNIFLDIEGGTYHSHAYTNSIINVCWMIPYSSNMQSIYGHYAIFFMPFLRLFHKLFGLDYLTGIFLISAVLTGISILLFAYILNHFARSTVTFLLGLFSIGEVFFMLQKGGVYLQLYPHRIIFPMLLLFMALREQERLSAAASAGRNVWRILFTVVVLSASFTWSPEIGMVTMLSYTAYRWYVRMTRRNGSDAHDMKLSDLVMLWPDILLYILLPFLLSYGTVLAYNLAAGSSLSFREFLFPLISDRDYISNIELPMPDVLHAWVPTALLFLCFVCAAFFRVLKPGAEAPVRSDEDADASLYFISGILSLGLMLYYINRPVAGALGIVILIVPILLAALLSRIPSGSPKGATWHTVFRTAIVFVLFMMSFDGIWSLPSAVNTARNTMWKRAELQEFAEEIWTQVPPDAYAFGEGVPELMSMIDRDTYLHTTEWSLNSMPLDTMEYARKEMEGRPWFFCNMFSLYYMQENYPGLTDEYDLHEIFRYGDAEFGLFYHK